MTEACFCDYPVNLKRARRVFAKASAQLKAAHAKHAVWLKTRAAEELAYESAMFPYSYYFSVSQWAQLSAQEGKYSRLHDLAARVSELRLTRAEICDMASAEREDFAESWDVRVEKLMQTPVPELPPKSTPQEVTANFSASQITKRKGLLQTLWDSL